MRVVGYIAAALFLVGLGFDRIPMSAFPWAMALLLVLVVLSAKRNGFRRRALDEVDALGGGIFVAILALAYPFLGK